MANKNNLTHLMELVCITCSWHLLTYGDEPELNSAKVCSSSLPQNITGLDASLDGKS